MYSVLIVDDEHLVRFGIKSMIHWERIGFTVIGDTRNGNEGLQAFEALNPDVVITDIKMPIMDGLEMFGHIRESNKETKVIVLTCMQDFEFAQKALRMGAYDYLIKSDMMPEDLEKVMITMKDVLDSERDTTHLKSVNKETSSFTENIAKEKFLWELSQGTMPNSYMIQDNLSALGLEEFNDNLRVWVIGIDYLDKRLSNFKEEDRSTYLMSGQNLLKKILTERSDIEYEIYSGQSGVWNVLIKAGNDFNPQYVADDIINQFNDEIDCTVTIGAGTSFIQLRDLRDSYSLASQCYRNKIFLGCARLICVDDIAIGDRYTIVISMNYKKLNEMAYSLHSDDVASCLNVVFEEVAKQMDGEKLQMLSLELLLNMTNVYAEMMNDSEWLYERKKDFYEQIKWLETVNDYREWFLNQYEGLVRHISKVYTQDRSSIDKVVKYIAEHYHEELSLQQLSSYVHLSKNYFANLFKKEVGDSFVEYVTKFRIDKAKSLLKRPDLKIGEIGPMVGIVDSKYFSKVFKKITGLTPQSFKESHMTSNENL